MKVTVKSALVFTFLLQNTTCTRKVMEGFIVGGHKATIKVYPHSVFLSMHCEKKWICGGAIINQILIITAAHCLKHCSFKKRHRLEVKAGTSDLNKAETKRKLKRFVIHQAYNEKKVHNDIGIAMMDKAISFGANIKRVIIPKRFPPAAFAKVAGWGVVDDATGVTSTILKHVNQKLRSTATCKMLGDLSASMFCAGSTDYYEDRPSEGDSGSALITDDYTEIGLVSFVNPPFPALMVYTNVSYFYNWVSIHAKEIFCHSKKKRTVVSTI